MTIRTSMSLAASTASKTTLTSAIIAAMAPDRKSTRLNSSHTVISYAVFCLKKKNVDGAPAEDSKLSQPFNQNSVAFLIGGVNFSGVTTVRFDGLIYEVQIYKYSLVDSEVDL